MNHSGGGRLPRRRGGSYRRDPFFGVGRGGSVVHQNNDGECSVLPNGWRRFRRSQHANRQLTMIAGGPICRVGGVGRIDVIRFSA